MAGSELRVEQNIASGSSSCSYTDGAKYVGCQVAERGWPQPQYMTGGRKRSRKNKTMKKSNKSRKYRKSNKSNKSRKCNKCKGKRCLCKKPRVRKGGFLQNAIVPFGLLALHKKTQKRHKHSHGRKHKFK